jgi:hypothetical protein
MKTLEQKFFVGVACAVILSSSNALAFTRTLGCDATGEICSEIFWPTNCADYLINDNADIESDIDQATLVAEIDASFAEWDDEITGCSFLTLSNAGFTASTGVAFDNDGEEENVVSFVSDGWLDLGPGHDAGAIALTSVFFDPETGVIVNADMEFNAEFFRPVIEGVTPIDPLDPRTDADIRNTITHEAGHFIGLDHSNLQDATMFAVASEGEIVKRDLAQDDIDGICVIYPIDEDPDKCKPAGFLPRRRIFNCTVEGGSTQEESRALLLTGLLFGLSLLSLSWRRRMD